MESYELLKKQMKLLHEKSIQIAEFNRTNELCKMTSAMIELWDAMGRIKILPAEDNVILKDTHP